MFADVNAPFLYLKPYLFCISPYLSCIFLFQIHMKKCYFSCTLLVLQSSIFCLLWEVAVRGFELSKS